MEVGWGKSAVVEAGGLAFTAAETDDKQWAVCLDPLTGATRWKKLLLAKPNRHFEKGPVTSPVVDGDRVYFVPYATFENDVWEMRGPIVCFKTDGTELWRADKTFWGTEASTPMIVGDTLYAGADNPQRVVLVALDKMTGKLRWSVAASPEKKNELGAPASLTYQVVDGVPQVIAGTYGTRELLGVHAVTGEVMWRYAYPADIIIGLVSTPVAIGSRLFRLRRRGQGPRFFRLPGNEGRGREDQLPRTLCQHRATDEHVSHGLDLSRRGLRLRRPAARPVSSTAPNFDDGRLLWKETSRDWTKDQNMVIADGLIFALTKNDELVLAEASRERYHELGRVRPGIELGRQQQPTIANGRMYIRGARWIVCYKVGE